jgi:fatty acid desaturase
LSKIPTSNYQKKDADKLLLTQFTDTLRQKGLLDKTPIRGSVEIVLELTGYVLLFTFMTQIPPIIVGLLFVLLMVRSTYIVHDLLHKQYFSRKWSNRLGLVFGNLLIGLSGKWWDREHNVMHHSYTNSAEKDTDVQGFGGAIIGKHDSIKFIHRHQHVFFFLLLPAIYVSFMMQSYAFVFEKRNWKELLFLLLHLLIPTTVLMLLGTVDGVVVLLITYLGYGLALGLVTITNHIGLPIHFGEDYKQYSWVDLQTRGSRNIRGSYLTHYLYGGLNTQIEHHIFPHASRFRLLKIAKETELFCKEHGFVYYATSPLQAYKEIYLYMRRLRLQ